MGKKSDKKALAAALARDTENMANVRGMYPDIDKAIDPVSDVPKGTQQLRESASQRPNGHEDSWGVKGNARSANARMNPPSGQGAPMTPNQSHWTPNQSRKALGNPVDVHPATRSVLDLHSQQPSLHPTVRTLTDVPVNDYKPGSPIVGHGVSHTISDAQVAHLDARNAAGRVVGLRNPSDHPRVGLSGLAHSAPGGSSNGTHVATQSAVSNAVAGKSSSVDALKDALNDLSRRTNGQ